ncbi:MAG: VCBS repeat-containing protein, partial [Bdellovibrionota bacterium]
FGGFSAANGPNWPDFEVDLDGDGQPDGQTDVVANNNQDAEAAVDNGIPTPPINPSSQPANIVVQGVQGTVNGVHYDSIIDWSNIPAGMNPLNSFFVFLNNGGKMGYFKIDTDVAAPFQVNGVLCHIPGPCLIRFTFAPTAPGSYEQALNARWRSEGSTQWNDVKILLRGKAYERLTAFTPGDGGGAIVRYWYPRLNQLNQFFTQPENFRGGARVAVADFNGDNVLDIAVVPGPGEAEPKVKIYHGPDMQLIREFNAGYTASLRTGLYVAACDLDNDQKAELVFGAGEGGAAHISIKKADGTNFREPFYAFEQSSTVGARVACGDVNGDGHPDIIAGAGEGGAPRVRIFNIADTTVLADQYAGSQSDRSGVTVGFGYFDPTSANGRVLTGNAGRVIAFKVENNQMVPVFNFVPYGNFNGNVSTRAMFLNNDWILDIMTGALKGGGPRVRLLDLFNLASIGDFNAFEETFRGCVRLGTVKNS